LFDAFMEDLHRSAFCEDSSQGLSIPSIGGPDIPGQNLLNCALI
jgi:hypothetical protein